MQRPAPVFCGLQGSPPQPLSAPAGYSAVASQDAATVVLTALQQTIVFDRHGDTERQVYVSEIRGGRYVKLAAP